MTSQTFTEFMTAVITDRKTGDALALAVGDKQGKAAVRAVAVFAKANGYEVSVAEAAKARQAYVEAFEPSADLADAELEGISGGCGHPNPVVNVSDFTKIAVYERVNSLNYTFKGSQ